MSKILIVEDVKLCLEGLVELLEIEGHTVIACDSGQKAVKAIRSEAFDIIFCDVVMPGITGWNILAETRSHGINIKTPFCYLTALATKSDREIGRKLGADWYLTKPYAIEDVKNVIKQLT